LAAALIAILDKMVMALVEARVFCHLWRTPPRRFHFIRENDMQRSTSCLLFASLAILVPLGASAAGNLSVFLKNYYTDYAIVLDCSGKSQLSPADAEAAKGAIAKIEAYYLNRDPSLNKDHLLKQATANKNDAFKMVKTQTPIEAGRFCKASLNDLVGKLREIDPASTSGKDG
jgi:hypothetical protein